MNARIWCGILAVATLAAPRAAEARRWAVVIGNNTGDVDDSPLRFAESDARRMGEVLVEVGGVNPADELMVLGAPATEVSARLLALEQRLRVEAKPADQLVIYFSAHADEGELHLGGGRLPLAELNTYAQRVPVGVAVMIIDSCRSGEVTRLKGLKPLGGTAVSVELPEVRGRVVIGSSGPDELAQESDAVGGSFFTHHLVAALRGLADSSHDGVVTLEEAYSYAYAHTVESTFATEGGVQHPSFHVDLRGQGDLALTAPGRARGRIKLAFADAAEILVTREPNHDLLGEFVKTPGAAELAVPPGAYAVRIRRGAQTAEQALQVPEGGVAVLRDDDLAPTSLVSAQARGSSTGLRVGLGGALGTGLTRSTSNGAGLGLDVELDRPDASAVLQHLAGELVARTSTANAPVAYQEQTIDLRAGPAWVQRAGPMRVRLAPELGAVIAHQDRLPGDASRTALAPELGGAAAAELSLAGPLSAFASGFGGAAALNTTNGAEVRPRFDAELGLALRL